VVDVNGTYTHWLAECQARAILIRPDFYVFGGTTSGETVTDLADQYLTRLGSPA
jgi:hypothetical protein